MHDLLFKLLGNQFMYDTGTEGGAGGTPPIDPPAPTGGAGTPPIDPPVPGTPPQAGTEKKPFATFEDEASLMRRIDREARSKMSALFTEFGVKDEESLREIMKQKKIEEEAKKTDAQKAQDEIKKLQKERDEAMSTTNKTLINSATQSIARELGIKPERVNKFVKLVEMDGIEVKDGKVDSAVLKERMDAVLVDFPEFKQTATPTPPKGGKDFSNGGGGSKLTMDQIRKMSQEEIAKRIVEVRAVMAANH